jgi:hypothetical protein
MSQLTIVLFSMKFLDSALIVCRTALRFPDLSSYVLLYFSIFVYYQRLVQGWSKMSILEDKFCLSGSLTNIF